CRGWILGAGCRVRVAVGTQPPESLLRFQLITDQELEIWAVGDAALHFNEQAARMLYADEEIEATKQVRAAAAGVNDVRRRASTQVKLPRIGLCRQIVRKLDVQADNLASVAEAEVNARPEGQVVDDFLRLNVTTQNKLRRATAHASVNATRQLRVRRCAD